MTDSVTLQFNDEKAIVVEFTPERAAALRYATTQYNADNATKIGVADYVKLVFIDDMAQKVLDQMQAGLDKEIQHRITAAATDVRAQVRTLLGL